MTEATPQETARRTLPVLQDRVEAHFAAAFERSPGHMHCRAGCDGCCRVRLTVFAIEAEPIALALARLEREQPEVRARIRVQATETERDACPMLIEGACAVYEHRPLICRSHGLPVWVEPSEAPGRIDVCPLNFTTAPPPQESVLRLEALNQPLSVMARMFDGTGQRVALTDLAGLPRDPADVSPG